MRWLKLAVASAMVLVVLAAVSIYALLRGSLPKLDGQWSAAALGSTATIERDALGVPTITAANRFDLAYATGFAHAQDRYFQMDLLRRAAAGELSALFGSSMVDADKRFRRHGFRLVARQVLANATPDQRRLIDAYVAGVNDALEAHRVRPFEYLTLQSQPAAWLPEDSILVAYAMYIDLNDSLGARELERARLHATLSKGAFEALYPRGTEWDATLDNVDLSMANAPLPRVDEFGPSHFVDPGSATQSATPADADYPGSNNWAVAGSRTATGAALVANDMHLGFRIPHIWYRVRMVVSSGDAGARDLIGVTLPGLPLLIAGSNTHIAWGFTNTHGDFDDLVVVETDAAHPNQYRDGERFRAFEVRAERIEIRGEPAIEVEYRDTVWGPLLDETLDGKLLAFAWTAQRPDATNLHQLALEGARSAEEAVGIANTIGIPVQNFVVADSRGHIAWTPIGKIPKRVGFDGRLPACWGCGIAVGWQGWIDPAAYPRILDPPNGQLWSANSRTLGRAEADLIGDEDMDRGARTRQIRDALLAVQKATPTDMLRIQLDNRALFLKRWRDLLVRMQDEAYLKNFPTRREALRLVEAWSGSAAVDDPGYRIVRAFRAALQDDIHRDFVAPAQRRYPEAKFRPSARFEDTVWRIVTSQPAHLLNPKYERWDLRIMAALDRALEQLRSECDVSVDELSECTWGRRNTLKMEHPLAGALPIVGVWLRMSRDALPGDNDMPRVQGVSFGASERFAVSPGHESEGYFHMPGGQSGHPLSPFFDAGHEAWARGVSAPFLPGETRYRLELTPLPSEGR